MLAVKEETAKMESHFQVSGHQGNQIMGRPHSAQNSSDGFDVAEKGRIHSLENRWWWRIRDLHERMYLESYVKERQRRWVIDAGMATCDQNAWAFRLRHPRAKAAMREILGLANGDGDAGEAGDGGAFGVETNREDHQAMSWYS